MTSSPTFPNSDSPRNLLKYQGQNYQFMPTYVRNRDPAFTDLRDPRNQGYYPRPSLWLNSVTKEIFILVSTTAIDVSNPASGAVWDPILSSSLDVTEFAVLLGGPDNTVVSLPDVAVGSVLVSGGVAANPAFSAFPQISGLGIGASPGSTPGITFDGTNFLNGYAEGSFTPTLVGGTVAGATTYVAQNGYYVNVGNMVWITVSVNISAATGTGNVVIGNLPFAVKNQTGGFVFGSCFINAAAFTFPVGRTWALCQGSPNSTNLVLPCLGDGVAPSNLQMTNAAGAFFVTLSYQK